MIASLRGVLEHKDSSSAVINVGGVGYRCLMSTSSLTALGDIGSTVHVVTSLSLRSDALTLFGFTSIEEQTLFENLRSVSGVGAKSALAVLSTYAPVELSKIIQAGDTTRLTAAPGIGKKTAGRIILELQGSLTSFPMEKGAAAATTTSSEAEAALALETMGFLPTEIALALSAVAADANTPNKDIDASEMVRRALKRLA